MPCWANGSVMFCKTHVSPTLLEQITRFQFSFVPDQLGGGSNSVLLSFWFQVGDTPSL